MGLLCALDGNERQSTRRKKTWGNSFIRDPNLRVEKNRWICLETMVKLNEPVTERNGELALWVDGRLVSHLRKEFPKGVWVYDKFIPEKGGRGIRWDVGRASPSLKVEHLSRVSDGGKPRT